MKRILPAIVLSQFFCTSLWFAGNAVMSDILKQFNLDNHYLGYLTSAVQAGFITGTLIFAILSVADRFSPVKVFFYCGLIAAAINLAVGFEMSGFQTLILCRFFTGFFLAGIYPVGMKIAADHYQQGLGRSLGFLVGALVIGTAFPHLLKTLMAGLPWRYVIFSTSGLAILGASAMLLLVPDGPYRKPAQKLNLYGVVQSFRIAQFRAAAFGYFGHMWELYAFWAFVPLMLTAWKNTNAVSGLYVPLWSFIIIVSGSIACMVSGTASLRWGTKRIATSALFVSGICCLLSPLVLLSHSAILLIIFLLIWGMAVIADSPMFSTMVAQYAPAVYKGTALTIVNSIGFAITIVSIQLISTLRTDANGGYIYMILAIGPLLGLMALRRKSA